MHDRILIAAVAAAIGAGASLLVSGGTKSSDDAAAPRAPAPVAADSPPRETFARLSAGQQSGATAGGNAYSHAELAARVAALEQRQQVLLADVADWQRAASQRLDPMPVADEFEPDPLDIAHYSNELFAAQEQAMADTREQAEDLAVAFDGERVDPNWSRQAERWLAAGIEAADRFAPECRETLCRVQVSSMEDEAALHLALGQLLSRKNAMLSGDVVSLDEEAGVAYYFERSVR